MENWFQIANKESLRIWGFPPVSFTRLIATPHHRWTSRLLLVLGQRTKSEGKGKKKILTATFEISSASSHLKSAHLATR